MQLQGVISEALPVRSGTGKNGQWRSAQFVLEYLPEGSKWAQHCAFEVWNERIDEFQLRKGDLVTLSLSIDAREWQGRWFNTVKAYGCVKSAVSQVQPLEATHSAPVMGPRLEGLVKDDDMPF